MFLLLVRVVEEAPKRGDPVAVLLSSGHMVNVGRDFDEEAFARAVAVLGVADGPRSPPSERIYMATEAVDMRNGIDGLRARVEAILKARDKVKMFWDKNGLSCT